MKVPLKILSRLLTVALLGLATLAVTLAPAHAKGTTKDKTKVVATWLAPVDGSVFTAPATITLSMVAESQQSSRSIVLVEFFNGTAVIGSLTSPTSGLNYQFSWANVSPGTYSLTAAATDDKGTFDETLPITITVVKANQALVGFNPATPITYAAGGSFTLTATGGASGNPVVFGSATHGVCTVNGNTVTMLTAGACTLTADQAGNTNYSAAPQVTATVTINKANQSITGFAPASPMTYANGGTFPLVAAGGISGNPIVFASTTPAICSVSGNIAAIQSAGTCTLTADQAGNTNYNAAPQVMANVVVNKAGQTISGFNPATPVTYATAPNNTFTLSATGGASGNAVVFASTTPGICTVTSTTITLQSAGVCIVTANQAGSGNYTAALQVTASVTINKADQVITGFNPATPITYISGGTFALTATAGASGSSLVFASATPATCVVSGNVVSMVGAGTCTLTADQAGNSNYNAAPQVTASVTINKANQSITGFNPATPMSYANGGTFTLTAMAGASGNPIIFASTTQTICSVTGNTATTLSTGACTLTADQAGNSNHNAAPQVTASVTINKADQIITGFTPVTPITYSNGGTFPLSAAGGASGNPVIFARATRQRCAQ